MLKRLALAGLTLAALTPWVSAPVALLAGVAFGLSVGNPVPELTRRWQTWLLQGSVVGLGAGLDLAVVARVGAAGFGQTLLGLSLALGATLHLSLIHI